MRILLQSTYYAPELTAIAKYNAEMATWLQRRGHQVRVLTTAPHFPGWRVHEGYSAARYSTERIDGVEVFRCPAWIPRRPNGPKRLVGIATLALSSLPQALRLAAWRPDVVIGVEPPLPTLVAGRLCAALSGAKMWLHVQDLEVDAAFELKLLKGQAARRFALWVERRLMSGCDRISTISHRMADRLLAKGVPKDALVMLPNWVHFETPVAAPRGYREELGIGAGDAVALYAGNMAAKQGLETIVEAARRLQARPDLWFVLVGDGAARAGLEQLAAALPRVRFLPIQPKERLRELLSFCDVHLLPQRAAAADLVMPSKLGGMLASGKPVVAGAADGTEIATLIDGRGLRVPPDDAAAMAEAVVRLVDDPALAASLGAAGQRHALEHLDREAILLRLEHELRLLCPHGAAPHAQPGSADR